MYFVQAGTVVIVDPRGRITQSRSNGSFFGEKGLLRQYTKYAAERGVLVSEDDTDGAALSGEDVPHTVCTADQSVRVASVMVDLYMLDRDDFNQLMQASLASRSAHTPGVVTRSAFS